MIDKTTNNRIHGTALAGVEALINRAFKYDPAARHALGELAGKVLKVDCTFPRLSFYVFHAEQGLTLLEQYEGKPDTTLTGNATSLAGLAVTGQQRSSFAGSGVEVSGNQQLLGDIQDILYNLDIDWETALARLVGDVPAQFIGTSIRAAMGWGKTARRRAADVATGFSQEEAQLSPSSYEFNKFTNKVRRLRTDTDRLEARIHTLRSFMPAPDADQQEPG